MEDQSFIVVCWIAAAVIDVVHYVKLHQFLYTNYPTIVHPQQKCSLIYVKVWLLVMTDFHVILLNCISIFKYKNPNT